MKKSLLILVSLLTAVSVTACSFGQDKPVAGEKDNVVETYDLARADDRDYDIALITDQNGINDEATLSVWKSIIAYGDSNRKTYKYYSESMGDDRESLITEAVERNARIVVLPNSSYKDIVMSLQKLYPRVSFLMVDTQPDEDFADNVHCVKFREEQTGYLTGYLLVMEGYKSLGFIGDGDNAKNRRYLYGMVQGADDATEELRLHDINIKYSFIEADKDKAKKAANQQYKDGAEIIFVCSETIAEGAAEAAKDKKKKLFCGERAFGEAEEVTLAAVEYDTVKAVDYAIKSGFDSDLSWNVGKENKDLNLGFESGCIFIYDDDESWAFKNLNAAFYREIRDKIALGEIVVSDKTDSKPAISSIVYSEVKVKEETDTDTDNER